MNAPNLASLQRRMATAVMRCGAADLIGPETKGAKLSTLLANPASLAWPTADRSVLLAELRRTRSLHPVCPMD